MIRKFELLRRALAGYGIHHSDLAIELGKCSTEISHRMTAKKPWTLEDMYKILELINVDPSQMHRYFPRKGVCTENDMPYKRKLNDRNRLAAERKL